MAESVATIGGSLHRYLDSVWVCRYFWLSLVKIDLRTRYRRSMLGIGWSLLHPIAMTIILCLVFHQIFKLDVRQYGPFLLSGLAFWKFITCVVLDGAQCLYQAEPYIRQHPAPMGIYPLRVVLGHAFHLLPALGLAVLLSVVLNGAASLGAWLSLLPTLLLLLLLGWSLAVLAGIANVYFPDTQHLCDIVLQILFYMTPIIYPIDILGSRGFATLLGYNPMAVVLGLLRSAATLGQVPALSSFAIAAAFVGSLTIAAAVVLGRQERQIIFYL